VKFFSNVYNKLRAARTRYASGIAFVAAAFIYKALGREQLVQQLGVLAWKLLLITIGVVLAHSIRVRLFPYVDLSSHVEKGDAAGGQIFLGVCILTGCILLALCAGL
jgi:hypothetical protein